MTTLFAGIPVRDFASARAHYEQLLGAEPSMLPHDTEAVWEVGEQRFVYVVEDPDRAGRALVMLWVDDLEAELARLVAGGFEPVADVTYDGSTRKVTFRDADGNELSFGGEAQKP